MESMRISTDGLQGPARTALVRDAAFGLFNLEADLAGTAPEEVHADLLLRRGPVVSIAEVRTSWSIVWRTPARAAAATTHDLLVYLIGEGGSWFRNGRGEQHLTHQGSVFVGVQDAAYTAAAAAGHDWRFWVMRVATGHLPLIGERVRRCGFAMLPEPSALTRLAADYVAAFGQRCDGMAPEDLISALQALDLLLAAALGAPTPAPHNDGPALHAARMAAAHGYMARWLQSPQLAPEGVARHVGISVRQLHRSFAQEGTSVALEIRRIRVAHAQSLLAREGARSVTDIALACGFDSLATFYRSFRAVTGMTATEWRHQG